MQIQHIRLTKAQLDKIPEKERVALVLFAHANNELSVLTKLFHACAKHQSQSPVEEQARNAQALTVGRILTGKLFECWRIFESAFFNSAMSKAYVTSFDDRAKAALTALKNYFGKKNLIKDVRNGHAFHYAADQINAGYASVQDDDPLDMYVHESNANSLYAFADTIANRSLFETIKPGDHSAAFHALVEETSRVIGWFNTLIGCCMSVAVKRYLGTSLKDLGAKRLDLGDVPKWSTLSFPYFIELDEETAA